MYIVTGGAGLIGSAVVWALNQAGEDRIIVVDHLGDSDKWKNLRGLSFTDYHEKEELRRLVAENKIDNVETIIHMGACSATTETDASYLIDNNYHYTRELAEFAVAREIHFIYASSAATYGDGGQGYNDDESAIGELRPMNAYGYSKQIFDLWAKRRGLFNVITGLKFTNVFGPNEYHKGEMRSVVHRAFEQIQTDGKVKLFKSHRPDYADGEQKRDFLYVKDAVAMILKFVETGEGGLYNIGSGRAETWNSLVSAVFAAMGLEPNIAYIDMPAHLRDRYQYYTKAEMSKFNASNPGMVARPLTETVADYVRNYLIPGRHLGDEEL